MKKTKHLSKQTRNNWTVDATVFLGALVSILTGIYFLFVPSGGYQGGRNPYYSMTILFTRQTWDDLHTWGGLLMILAVTVHVALHWTWVKMMARKVWVTLAAKGGTLSRGARINVLVDLVVALGFMVTALSALVLLFTPSGFQVNRAATALLLTRSTWDLLHTWGAVAMSLGAILHLLIHWRWVVNVTRRLWLPQRRERRQAATVQTTGIVDGRTAS